jgi:hypothetical protein
MLHPGTACEDLQKLRAWTFRRHSLDMRLQLWARLKFNEFLEVRWIVPLAALNDLISDQSRYLLFSVVSTGKA